LYTIRRHTTLTLGTCIYGESNICLHFENLKYLFWIDFRVDATDYTRPNSVRVTLSILAVICFYFTVCLCHTNVHFWAVYTTPPTSWRSILDMPTVISLVIVCGFAPDILHGNAISKTKTRTNAHGWKKNHSAERPRRAIELKTTRSSLNNDPFPKFVPCWSFFTFRFPLYDQRMRFTRSPVLYILRCVSFIYLFKILSPRRDQVDCRVQV